MRSYDFAVIIATGKMSFEKILDATDALGDAGCTDGTLCGRRDGMVVHFTRSVRSLQTAISSAIKNVAKAGFRVLRVEMEREAIPT